MPPPHYGGRHNNVDPTVTLTLSPDLVTITMAVLRGHVSGGQMSGRPAVEDSGSTESCMTHRRSRLLSGRSTTVGRRIDSYNILAPVAVYGWLGSRVVSVLDSGAAGPRRFKSQSRRCRVTVLGKLLTPIVPLFAKQRGSSPLKGWEGNCRPGGK